MTSADLAIVLGRFPSRQAAYAAAREHEVFRAALREVDLNYGLVAANSEMGRRRQEEIDAVLAAFVLWLEEQEATEAARAGTGGRPKRAKPSVAIFHFVIREALGMTARGETASRKRLAEMTEAQGEPIDRRVLGPWASYVEADRARALRTYRDRSVPRRFAAELDLDRRTLDDD